MQGTHKAEEVRCYPPLRSGYHLPLLERSVDVTLLSNWKVLGWYSLVSLIAAGLGLLLAVVPGVLVIGPLFYHRTLLNGGPFAEGDCVQIIGGKFAGKQSKVYEKWQGDQVRVDVGEDAAKKLKDIFQPWQLLRIPNTEQCGAAKPVQRQVAE